MTLRRQLEGRDREVRRLHGETGFRANTPGGMDCGDRGEIMDHIHWFSVSLLYGVVFQTQIKSSPRLKA